VSNGLRPKRAVVGLGLIASIVAISSIGAAGAAQGDSSASAAKKSKRCSRVVIRHIQSAKKRKLRKRDCRDLVIGNPEKPRKQRYDGKRIPTRNSTRCDFLDPSQCLQPWPNDYFTVGASTPTGRQLHLNSASMPANKNGVHIDPTDFNRSDGFSTGQTIVDKVPRLETSAAFNKSGLVPITDLGKFDDPGQAAVVINTATGQRQPIWAEIDSEPTKVADKNLLIRPARDFTEGAHYIVALRSLRSASGKKLKAPKSFRVYRDRLITKQKPIERRRAHMEGLFKELKSDGIRRGSLYVAWDFTVSSKDNLSSRVLSMRNSALGASTANHLDDPAIGNGDVEDGDAPTFTVDTVTDDPNADILRDIKGTLTDVPCYLNTNGCPPGSRFAFSGASDRTPNFNSGFTMDVPFECLIPNSITNGVDTVFPGSGIEFGHGLLGSYEDVAADGERMHQLANEHNRVVCAVSWAGFSDEDTDTVVSILGNLSKFPLLTDRVEQSYINFMFLGRAMTHSGGFNSDAAFQVDPTDPTDSVSGGDPTIDTSQLDFEGISQGAVEGGALTALSPDISRSVLNVGGMTYSTLIGRSSDWPTYELFLNQSYPDLAQRPLIVSMVQVLWDRAETNGYSAHATSNPYANTPSHQILLQADYGDFQVANIQAEVEARTMGLKVYDGESPFGDELYPGRHWSSTPLFGLTRIPSFPYAGSALVYWDGGPHGFTGTDGCGSSPPPNGNIAPKSDANGGTSGCDPHSYSRKDVQARQQVADFLDGGFGICTDGVALTTAIPCYDNGFDGP
jgi:hypothetical protein